MVLTQVAILVLVGHWLDIFVLVGPSLGPVDAAPHYAAAATLAVAAAMILVLLRRSRPVVTKH